MTVVKAEKRHFDEVKEIYALARKFMKEQGNEEQWGDGYPPESLILEDIELGSLYLVIEGEEILAVFFYQEGEDPTYSYIYDGAWLNSERYAVIHRVAVRTSGRGVVGFIFNHCAEACGNLKIDTHEKNLPMQKALLKNGFKL